MNKSQEAYSHAKPVAALLFIAVHLPTPDPLPVARLSVGAPLLLEL